jgi:hypothetical protein
VSGRSDVRQSMARTQQPPAAGPRLAAALLAAALPVVAAQDRNPGAAPAASSPPAAAAPSEAERLVFLQDHLANTRRPRALRYVYVEDGEGRARVTDRAVLTLAAGAAGRCCDVHGEYLSGPLAVSLPDVSDAKANPVLLYFLEGEVRRLQRTTQGQTAHFRRRIRLALAEGASITDGTIRWGTQAVPARTVRVRPFLDDPFRARFEDQAATEYAFVLSDAVPGGVYQLRATLPAAAAGASPRASRTLTIEEPN